VGGRAEQPLRDVRPPAGDRLPCAGRRSGIAQAVTHGSPARFRIAPPPPGSLPFLSPVPLALLCNLRFSCVAFTTFHSFITRGCQLRCRPEAHVVRGRPGAALGEPAVQWKKKATQVDKVSFRPC
jgi:hypothetical protein